MSAQSTPIGMDISKADEERNKIFLSSMNRLQHFAYRAMNVHELNNTQFIVVCIDVDSQWRWLVDKVIPDTDWQPFRDLGKTPIARGVVLFTDDFREILISELPDLETCLSESPAEGTANCIVLDDSGGTVYEIKPIEMQELS